MFAEPAVSTDQLADIVCDYINFCVECSIPQKTVTVHYDNYRPWISELIKYIFNQKAMTV